MYDESVRCRSLPCVDSESAYYISMQVSCTKERRSAPSFSRDSAFLRRERGRARARGELRFLSTDNTQNTLLTGWLWCVRVRCRNLVIESVHSVCGFRVFRPAQKDHKGAIRYQMIHTLGAISLPASSHSPAPSLAVEQERSCCTHGTRSSHCAQKSARMTRNCSCGTRDSARRSLPGP